jgi:hypothetical protein
MISGVRFWSWRQPLHFTIGNKKSLVSLLVSKLCHIGVTSKTELLFGNSGVRRRSTTTKMLLSMYSLQVISWWAKNILSTVTGLMRVLQVTQDQQYFQRVKWQYMILDEAQNIKNSSSLRWKTLLGFQCRNRLLLTGTPIQNSMQGKFTKLHPLPLFCLFVILR